MAEELDVYRDWLGIAETQRPLDYYQLLRLPRFEDDTAKIRTHYRKMNAHVRKFATGEYAPQSQALLNELARAMLCLTDDQRKREYDASLGRKDVGRGRRRTFEEILLASKVIDRDQLTKARDFANAVGLELRDAVMQQKLAAPEAVMLAYAESVGLPCVDLDDVGVDEQLVAQIPPALAKQRSCVPLMADEGRLLMASCNPLVPDVEEELRLRLGMPVRTVLCTPASINEAIAKYYARAAAAPAAQAKELPADQAPAETEAKAPLTPQERQELAKQRVRYAIIAFNVTVVVTILYKSLLGGGIYTFMGVLLWCLVAVLLGSVVGGITYFVMSKKNV